MLRLQTFDCFSLILYVVVSQLCIPTGHTFVLYKGDEIPQPLRNTIIISQNVSADSKSGLEVHRVKRSEDEEIDEEESDEEETDEQDVLPQDLEDKVDDYVLEMHATFKKSDGDSLELKCSHELTQKILEIYPKATYRWKFNNNPLRMDPARMIFMNGVLVFQTVVVEDTGVYVCEIEYSPKVLKLVAFFSLLVEYSEPTVRIQATRQFELKCPSQFIGLLYKHAVRSWLLDGDVYKKLHKIPAMKKEPDVIPELVEDDTGEWTCEVREPTGGKAWSVAFYNLRVDGAPPPWQRTVDMVKRNIVTFATTGGILLAGILTLLLLIVYKTAQADSEQNSAIDSMKMKLVQLKREGFEFENPALGDSGSEFETDSDSFSMETSGTDEVIGRQAPTRAPVRAVP